MQLQLQASLLHKPILGIRKRMDLIQCLKHFVVEGIRRSGPHWWPRLAYLPKIGKYARAHILTRAPFPDKEVSPPSPVELIKGLSSKNPRAMAQANRLLPKLHRPPPDIEKFVTIQAARRTDWSGEKVAVIAHWDPDGIIDPYVLYYATALQHLGYRTVLASDRPLQLPENTPQLPSPLDAVIHRRCPGYDFTSWKAALAILPGLYAAGELLLTNDSIFAPVGDLAAVHEAMAHVPCDFWGLVESQDKRPHLQSYYLVFRPDALLSPAFRLFWEQVGMDTAKECAIGHELNLGLWLAMHGLRPGAFSPAANQFDPQLNPTHCGWDFLLKRCGVPIIKRDLLFRNPYKIDLKDMIDAINGFNYPLELIMNYANRRNVRPNFL